MNKITKKLTKKITRHEPKARGTVAVVDITARIIASISLTVLSQNTILRYVAYYMAATALMELAYSVYKRNAKTLQ